MTEHTYGESVLDFGTDDRVELHPATDWWMRGARYGTVMRPRQYHAPTTVKVKLDRAGIVYVSPQNIRKV